MAHIQIAQIRRDLMDAFGSASELLLGKGNLFSVYISCKTFSNLPGEQPGEVAGAQMAQLGHFVHGTAGVRVGIQIAERGIQWAALGYGNLGNGFRCHRSGLRRIVTGALQEPLQGLLLMPCGYGTVDNVVNNGADQPCDLFHPAVGHSGKLFILFQNLQDIAL